MDIKYKVKLANGRVLGPLDLERIAALTKKGTFVGTEPTSVPPFNQWKQFSSYPDLANLLLEKLESEREHKTRPKIVSEQVTATLVRQNTNPENNDEDPKQSGEPIITKSEGEDEMPTLLDIPIPPVVIDKEKTIIAQADPQKEKTKMLTREDLEFAGGISKEVHQAALRKKAEQKSQAITQVRKQLLSPKVAIILAIGLVLIGIKSLYQEPDPVVDFTVTPKTIPFPFVGATAPQLAGKIADPRASMDLAEGGIPFLESGEPLLIIKGIKNHFYPSVQKNPKNPLARALLATAYLRLAEILPRDEHFFETLKKLLFPIPPKNALIPEYVIARSEYLQLLLRYDQALETIEDYLTVTQNPELLYQKAFIHFQRRELDPALAAINKAIKISTSKKINPKYRHLLVELLNTKGSDAALAEAITLHKESPLYGPGLIQLANLLLQAKKPGKALQIIEPLIKNPLLVDRTALAQAFLTASRALEGVKNFNLAVIFAESAHREMPSMEEATDHLYKLRSHFKPTQQLFTYILAGRRHEKEKTYDKAENAYILAREAGANSALPLSLWGSLLEKKGDLNSAINRLQAAVKLDPRSSIAAIKLAELQIRRYDFEQARLTLDRAADLKRYMDRIEYWRGYIFRKVGKLELGESRIKHAASMGSRFPEIYITLGSIEAQRKNREISEFYYAMALRYDPLNSKALLGAALARFHLESPSRAITFLKEKLNAQPNSAPILTNLAVIYRYAGDKDSTKNYLQNAMRSDPTYAEAFRQIGDLAREEAESYSDNYAAKENNYRFALASYEGYSKLSPFDPEGYMSTAELYYFVRDFGAAAKNYYKVLDLAPNYPGVRLRLAAISLNGRDHNKALQLVEEELKRYPESPEAHIEMGKIQMSQAIGYLRGGDRALAEQKFTASASSFTTAARLDESNASAIFFLGYVNLERGNYDSAQTLLERAKKLEPLSPDVHLQLGRVYLKKKYIQKAVTAFTDARGLTQDPDKIQEIDAAMKGQK